MDGARGRSAFSKVALGGSLLVNVALLSYYASHRNDSGRTSLLATGQDPAIKSTLSSLEQKITVTSSSKPPSPSSKGKTVYDVAVNAEVDSALTQGLGVANSLQVARLVKREQALWASDAKLAKRTTAGGNVRLPSQQPEHQAYEAHFEWGTVNPVSGLQRLTCSDSLADASGNDAPKNRFWGGPFAGKSGVVVDSCAPGEACNDPCARSACNVGEVYTVECPNNCLKQELGGSVFGQGTPQNPFMDLSSVCRAALAAGVSAEGETSIVAFEVVEGAKSYQGIASSKTQVLTTLDYLNPKPHYAAGSWYGVRGFKFVPASEAIQVSNAPAPGGEGSHMVLSKKKSMLLAETGDAKMSVLAKLDGGQENMALYFDGSEGSMLTYEGGGATLAESITGGLTVEAWVYDSEVADRSGYVGFFQDMMGSPDSGGDGIWAGQEPLPDDQKDYGFVLGTDQGAFSFGVASVDTNRLDYLSTQACLTRHHVGTWVHVAGTYDGEVMKLYVDGKLASEAFTQTGAIAWPSEAEPAELTMGAWLGLDVQTYYKGMLDEVRIWSSALSSATILANMHQTLAPPLPPAGLVMYWRFDRAYCDEVNWIRGKVAVTPGKDEMDLVLRVPSGALVELQSVSWACLAECPAYAPPQHGGAYPSAVTHEGDTVSVYCDSGYELRCADDSACDTATCQNDGENQGVYDPEGPAECIGICSSYPTISNGKITPAGQVYVGDMVEIACNEGYALNDDANSPATCMDGGKGGMFDKTGAACVAVCDAYADVAHGSVEPSEGTRQNDLVTITCDDGYELVQSVVSGSPATCTDGGAKYGGGVYDKPAAECRAKCSGYPAIEHGQVSPSGAVWVDTKISIACKEGYVLESGSPSSATCVDTGEGGDYDASGAVCVAVCVAFPEVEFGTVTPSGEVRAGDVVSVVCDEGYALEGDAAVFSTTCEDSGLGGEFDRSPPRCVEKPVYCAGVVVEHGYVSPDGDLVEGASISVTCYQGFHFDEDVASPFTATCIKDDNGGETINGVDYLGVLDLAMPVCVPDIDEEEKPEDAVIMSASDKGLYSECAKWRDNKDGVGQKNDLALRKQMAQMAYCMQQDCQASLSASRTCRWTDGNRLCYSMVGQGFCGRNIPNSACQDLGEAAGDVTNFGGDGTWVPLTSVEVYGSAALLASSPFTCNCFKGCAHYTGSSELKKYRCTNATPAAVVGTIEGSPAQVVVDTNNYGSANKDGQCACSCGYAGTATWEAGDAQ